MIKFKWDKNTIWKIPRPILDHLYKESLYIKMDNTSLTFSTNPLVCTYSRRLTFTDLKIHIWCKWVANLNFVKIKKYSLRQFCPFFKLKNISKKWIEIKKMKWFVIGNPKLENHPMVHVQDGSSEVRTCGVH